jgi:hypothetical protein
MKVPGEDMRGEVALAAQQGALIDWRIKNENTIGAQR